ncbi:MAG: Eco57I restriction-modification methylase domain-containing protein [Proteobacteria bacterium]|nr:Eco57I restriction-modification methylase domain-containing protein [Pseudomonadota bacterium]
MQSIEETTDSDIAEVKASRDTFSTIEDATAPVEAFFSLLMAERMMGVFAGAPKKTPPAPAKMAGKSEKELATWREQVRAFEAASALGLALEGAFGDPVKIATGETQIASAELVQQLALLPAGETEPQSSLFPKISIDDRRRLLADELVKEARERGQLHRFFHWEIGFPNVWSNLLSKQPAGGFDAVIGNPPYVRQELLGDEIKRALKADYLAFDGMADLYIYFFEQGLRLLRPGGLLSYVVTNKWLKAGYAEALRELFGTKAEVEFVADFGHAKHFFPDADVFPSVIVVRRPESASVKANAEAQVCVLPREAVPEKGLSAAVAAAIYPLPRGYLTKEGWALEPQNVLALLDKVKRKGAPLSQYAKTKPCRGLLTGLNEAFVVDTATRDQLVKDDPSCQEIIKPYLRGQDIERWFSPPTDLHMIVLKSSSDHNWPWAATSDEAAAENQFKATFPSLHAHMKRWESFVDPNTDKMRGLRHREDHGRFWWELRSCAYYDSFEQPKVLYVDIGWSASFSLDTSGRYTNNTAYFIPSGDPWLTCVLNAPIGWWFAWRRAQHGKDEALRYFTSFVEDYPIPLRAEVDEDVSKAAKEKTAIKDAVRTIQDWLRHEFGLNRQSRALAEPHLLDADGFVTAVRNALPKKRKWSAAEIARLKQEHADTLSGAKSAATRMLDLERKLSDCVNAAYGLTAEEVALMWQTAPPRMPLDPAVELKRIGSDST